MIIYKTTNLIDGKIYIGKAQGIRVANGYLGSGVWIKRAIKKYGKENFKRDTIDISASIDEQNLKEMFWINFYNARNPEIGYNILEGGKGGDTLSTNPNKKAILKKMSLAKEGFKNPNYGKVFSSETKLKMSISAKNRDNHFFGKDNSMYGRHHSEETKLRISLSQKKRLEKRLMEATNG